MITSLVLTYYAYITGDEVKHAVDAYNLQVRDKEKKTVYLDLVFETIQKALRVSLRRLTYNRFLFSLTSLIRCSS